MIKIFYTPKFIRHYKKLPETLRIEVEEKVELFRKDPQDSSLKFHKLKGKLKGYSSFSVNYAYRIIVQEDAKGVYALLAVGDHDVYK